MDQKSEKLLFNEDKIIDNWDKLYKLKSIPWDSGKEEKILSELIIKRKIQKGLTLDLGCGQGTDTVYLAKNGFPVTGIDISLAGLKLAEQKAKREGLKVTLCQGDVLNLPFTAESFFFINDRGCFHHIEKQKRQDYSREIYRTLKKEGIFLLRFFGEKYFVSRGSGQKIFKSDVIELFSHFFHIGNIYDYKGKGNKWSVEMSWALMTKKIFK